MRRSFTLKLPLFFTFLLITVLGLAQDTYTSIGIIGSSTSNGWDASTPMKLANSSDMHQWTLTLQLVQGEIKFRANNSWDVNWGGNDFPSGTGVRGGLNIQVPTTSYYTVTFNDVTGAYNFQAFNPVVYTTVGLVGDATASGWNASTAMTKSATDPHSWTLEDITLSLGQVKFRANDSWDVNWGGGSLPGGTAVQNGPNIPVPAGEYKVTFNDVTGEYYFTNLHPVVYQTVGIIGTATTKGWDASTPMRLVAAGDPNNWVLTTYLQAGDLKFRANDSWDVNWGGGSLPSGTATMGGPNISIGESSYYTIHFNDITGNYSFTKITPVTYSTVGIIGNATSNGWDASTPMVQGSDTHTWTLTSIKLLAGGAKFRANDSWDVNWGGTDFPTGVGVPSGENIPVTTGTYNITFNDITGEYNFEAVTPGAIVVLSPAVPTADEPVTITYDASQGTSGLQNAGKVYMHSGVVLSGADGTTWSNVVGNWGQDDGMGEMSPVAGQPNKWQITLPSIRQYYHVDNGIPVFRLAMVFRNADGTQTGKSETGGDIFVNINPGDYVRFTSPAATEISALNGQQIQISAEASTLANTITLDINEGSGYQTVAQVSNSQTIAYGYTPGATGRVQLRVTAQIRSNTVISEKAVSIRLRQPNTIATLPAGVKEGINYGADCTTATLVLYAPNKTYVDVVGDFNNWQTSNASQMNKTPDGNYYWLTISNLTPGTEYAFNYKVDDTIYIADPYTEKVLDPDNDPSIPAATYPNLKAYPVNANVSPAKNGIMSVLQTCQSAYNWHVTSFTKPDKQNLVTYELLVRDFGDQHNYQMLIDTLSYFKRLGINAIELMPVNEFSGNDSWGYNPTFYCALDKYYGTKNKLKEFIDSCHSNGIAIIMDVVYNQMQADVAPQGKLYWDNVNNRPATNNPWLNIAAPHPYFPYQYDLNHESTATRYLVQRSMEYWLSEYKVDGFRMDAGKGFTQKCTQVNAMCPVADGSIEDYDASRVDNLERYYDSVELKYPDTYMIIEFLGQQRQEEQEYAKHGFMLWGNNNLTYNQATMGYADNSNFSKMVYNSGEEAFTTPSEMGYMESHDEERLMFKNLAYGNSSGSYNVKDLPTALQRQAAAAAVFFTVPGPKMLWQFGERGYDISIDAAGGRVSAKPPHWEYMQDANRLQLWNVYSRLINLKLQYPAVFNSTAFNYDFYDNGGLFRQFQIADPAANGMKVTVVANFDVVPQTRTITFQSTGTWYSFVSDGTGTGLNGGEGASATISTTTQSITLQPGEYHVYTDRQVHIPKCTVKAASTAGAIQCNGGTTTVIVTATGGVAPYTGTGTFAVSAGAYSFVVADANGCTDTTTGVINEPPVLTASSTAGTISCYGGTTTVTVTGSGGTAPYSGTGNFTKGAGSYTFTVTDKNGCTASTSVSLTQPTALTVSVGDVYAVNPGGNANTIYLGYGPSSLALIAAVSGGTPPYQYTWKEPAVSNSTKLSTTASVTVSPSIVGTHTYKFTVTDSKGCSKDVSATVSVIDVRCSNNKVTVCTKGQSKCVAVNTVAGLLSSGSYLGSCAGTQQIAASAAGTSSMKQATQGSAIKVYPNPSAGLFTLRLKNIQADQAQVTVMDMKGVVMSTRTVAGLQKVQSIPFDLSRLAAGMYMIKLVTKEGVQTTPVIIAR